MNFLDLFPDTPAAVEASKGARDILENQHKQAMGFMEMENALMRTAQARQQMEELERLRPLQQTMSAVKMLQGMNVQNAGQAFGGIDPLDINALTQGVRQALPGIKSDYEAELEKTTRSAQASAAVKYAMEEGRNTRDAAERRADRDKEVSKAANERLEVLLKRWPRTPTTPRRAQDLVSDYESLIAMGDSRVAQSFWAKHSKLLEAAGHDAPSGASRAKPKAQEKAGEAITYKSKSGKVYKIDADGNIEGQ